MYEAGKQYWNYAPAFDSLDFGLDLVMETGECFGIIWGQDFYQYGISLINDSLKTELNQVNSIDVTSTTRWLNIKNKEITSSQLIWSWVKEEGLFRKKIYYPQDLIITFDNNQKIYISALDIQSHDMGMCDNITIFFSSDVAHKYKVGQI